ALYGGVEVGRVVATLPQLVGALLEEVLRVVVVERHARAEGVDQGEALVGDAALDQFDQVLDLPGVASSHVGGAGGDGEWDRVDRVLHAARRRALRLHALDAGRRGLSGRQAVDLVVHDDVGQVDVAPHRVQ